MGNTFSKLMANKLELYLNDVYKKECAYKAEQEEIEFIQSGIETIVQKIVDLVLELLSKFEYSEFKDYFTSDKSHEENIKQFQQSLVEVYFPIRTEKHFIKVQTTKSPIIKVGSFYEKTKNNFPDEFDFIFLLFCIRQPASVLKEETFEYPDCRFLTATCIGKVTADNQEFLKYVSPNGTLHETRALYFDEYLTDHGPASMLQFIYDNGSGEYRFIYVDLVPAFKIIVKNDILPRDVKFRRKKRRPTKPIKCSMKNYVNAKSFRKEAESAGYCFNVAGIISFTETEVHFMRNVLSKKHLKVYRVLKFLINGHGDEEILKHVLESVPWNRETTIGYMYTSYQIKTMIINHHDECTNTDTDEIGPCVLQVLEAICKYDSVFDFPKLHRYVRCFHSMFKQEWFYVFPYLECLIYTFKKMQISEDTYGYENVKLNSVSRQYLDTLGIHIPVTYLDGRPHPCGRIKSRTKFKLE